MDVIESPVIDNPFAPGAGTPPPLLAGREQIVENFSVALHRALNGKPTQPILVTGLRGVGKTVLLNQFVRQAAALESTVDLIFLEVSTAEDFSDQLRRELYRTLAALGQTDSLWNTMLSGTENLLRLSLRTGRRLLRSARQQLQQRLGRQTAADAAADAAADDSDDADAPAAAFNRHSLSSLDLSALMVETVRAASGKNSALLLMIDEIQHLPGEQFDVLISAVHRTMQLQLPLVLTAAGLPSTRLLVSDSKAYAERMFQYVQLGPLSEEEAGEVLTQPFAAEKIKCDAEMLAALYQMTGGYPYFLQEWGYALWNTAPKGRLGMQHLEQTKAAVLKKLDEDFFRTRLRRLRPTERSYLLAMASLGGGPHRSGDIAKACGKKVQSVAPVRDSLIRKGMIYSPEHGLTAFSVPLFDDFIQRA